MSWFSNPEQSATPDPDSAQPPLQSGNQKELHCSFCGKSQREVLKLIAGPDVYICDECILLCNDIVAEGADTKRPPLIPKEAGQLLSELDERIVGLRSVKRAFVAAVRQQVLRLSAAETSLPPLRLLIVGPTGTGKTTLGRALCAVAPVPAYHADVSRLSESGYVGEDIENFLDALLQAAGDDLDWAQQGVLFLDGLENIRSDRPLNNSRDISGDSVQRELLRLLDGLACEIPTNQSRRHPQAATVTFVPERLLIAGAMRLEAAELSPTPTDRELRDTLRAAGMRGELLARFDRIVPLSRPDEEALMVLLDHPQGLVAEAYRALEALGGSLSIDLEARRELARAAATDETGAWALGRPIQRYMEEVFSSSNPAKAWRIDVNKMKTLIAGVSDEAKARAPYR